MDCSRRSPAFSKNPDRTFVRRFRCLLLFWAAALLPAPVSDACGWQDYGFSGYSFLNARIVDQANPNFPFLVDFGEVYREYFATVEERKERSNIEEWVEKVCQGALPADAHFFIYQSTREDLELFRTALLSKNMPVPFRLQGNTFARYLQRNKCLETVDYLIFAKSCEPHVVEPASAWEQPKRNVAAMEELIDGGLLLFRNTSSHYLRLRYAYQIVRLAHYAGLYDRALELYDFLIPKIDITTFEGRPSLIYYWLLGHRAGALRAKGEYVEASYLYSQIFEHCPSRQVSAYRSFYLKTDEDWEKCLLLCKDDSERITLYTLRAKATDSKAVEEMELIYELDPKHPNLELLLVKEIRELEKDLLGIEFNNRRSENKRYYQRPRPFAGDYVITLQKFARRLREEQRVARPEFWHLAEGYLELLAGDFYAAGKTFREVSPEIQNKQLQEQLQVFTLAQQIYSFDRLNDSIEELAYEIRKNNKWFKAYPDFPDFLRDKFTSLYREYGRPGKAFRSQYGLEDLRMNPREEIIEDLLKIAIDPNQTSLERLLLQDRKGNDMTNALWDMKAVNYLRDYQLEAALESMKEIPRTRWDEFGRFDPFRATVVDCISCPHSKDSIDLFNRGQLIEELLDLEYKTRSDLENNARHYYRIGVALYNMTYFGHSWNAMDYFRSGSSWPLAGPNEVLPQPGAPYGNRENFDVSRAMYYFEKARQNAKGELLKAQATYMAAKCEHLMYYMSDIYQPPPCCNRIPDIPVEFSTNFERLKTTYNQLPEGSNAETFFKNIIKECAYFRYYLQK